MFEFVIPKDTSKSEAEKLYDVIIVGSGPAGLTAAIYSARDGKRVLVLERAIVGGLAASTEHIENYPGFPQGISGQELMGLFREQAERFGTEVVEFNEVARLNPVKPGLIEVHTTDGQVYQGRAVLLATGSEPKKLGLPGEAEFYGRGVSYCATCDGPLFRGKRVAVIGMGNSGLQEGLGLLEYAESVAFVEFLPASKGEKILQERVMQHPRSSIYLYHKPLAILGEDRVTGLVIEDRATGEQKTLPVDGIFIYVGYVPFTQFAADVVELDRLGYIITDEHQQTRTPGIFAAGDVRSGAIAQIAVAVGDGARAALSIKEYLQHLEA